MKQENEAEQKRMAVGTHVHEGPSSHGILRRFSYLISAHWIREAFQTVFLIYLARTNTTTFGEFMLALSLGQVLLFTSEYGLNQHLVTLLARGETTEDDAVSRVTTLKSLLLLCGWTAAVIFITLQTYSPMLRAIILIIGTSVGAEALASSFFVAFRMRGRQDLEGRLRATAAVFGFGFGIAAMFTGASPLWVSLFKPIETVIILLGSLRLAKEKVRVRLCRPSFDALRSTGRASMVFVLMAVATSLYNKGNIFFLQQFGGAESVAQYSAAWQTVDGISALASNLLLANVIFPLLAGLWVSDRATFQQISRNCTVWLLAVALPIVYFFWVESDRFIMLVYGGAYEQAVWMQRLLAPTIAVAFLHNLAAYIMMSMGKAWLLLGFYLIGLVFNLLCCALSIPASPLMGTCLSIVATKVLVGVLTFSYCQYRIGMISLKPLGQLAAAGCGGATAYLLLMNVLPRELIEIAGILPILILVLQWKRTRFATTLPPLATG